MSLVLAIFGISVFYRPSRLLWLLIGGFIPVALVAYFQWKAFGNPLTPGHLMLENQHFVSAHRQGIFGVKFPSLETFTSLSFNTGYGFFGTSPFMWLGLLLLPIGLYFAAHSSLRARDHLRNVSIAWFASMFSLWFAVSGIILWRGGWTVGPRFFGAAPPFFAFAAVIGLEHLARHTRRRSWVIGLAGGLAAASVATLGTVGLFYNTLPESVSHVVWEFTLPAYRAGFLPHDIGEWFGLTGHPLWWLAAIALVMLPLMPLLPWRGIQRAYLLQTSVALIAFGLGFFPQLLDSNPGSGFVPREILSNSMWEPKDQDVASRLRARIAARPYEDPSCTWLDIAQAEAAVGDIGAAHEAIDHAQACTHRTSLLNW